MSEGGSPGEGGFTPPPPIKHITEGSFFIGDDRTVCQSLDGRSVPVAYGGATLTAYGSLTGRRLAALVGLRDRARRVLQSQNEGWPGRTAVTPAANSTGPTSASSAPTARSTRPASATTADGHVIRRMPNIVKFKEDPDAMLVMSLEEYDEVTGKAAKAAIMQKDVVGRKPPVTTVASAEEGLLASLDQKGAVDLPFIASLYGKPEEQVTPSWAT